MDKNSKHIDNISIEEFTRIRVDELCKELNMSRYKLGLISGVAQSSFSTMMTGKTSPSLATLQKICDAFGISIYDFFNKDLSSSKQGAREHLWLDLFRSLDESEQNLVLGYVQGLKAAKERLAITKADNE